MNDKKKPSEPVEEERWALQKIPTGQLVEELMNRNGVKIQANRFCRTTGYHIKISMWLNDQDCPPCLR